MENPIPIDQSAMMMSFREPLRRDSEAFGPIFSEDNHQFFIFDSQPNCLRVGLSFTHPLVNQRQSSYSSD